MIFTIGFADVYDNYIDCDKNAAKAKKGSVWETYKDVKFYLEDTQLDNYQIYGVEADWENDTEIIEGVKWRSLKRDAKLIKIRLLNDIFPWIKDS